MIKILGFEICIFSGNLVLQALLLFLNLNINKSEHYIVCDILSDIAYDIVYDIPHTISYTMSNTISYTILIPLISD